MAVCGSNDNGIYYLYKFDNQLDFSWKNGPIQWQRDPNVYNSYRYSLKSGEVAKNEISYIDKYVNGPGNITFWWKKSSLLNSSTDLYFLVDNNEKYIYDDFVTFGWQMKSYDIDVGTHKLTWAFRLGDYGCRIRRGGEVAGWIDDVEIMEPSQPSIIPNCTIRASDHIVVGQESVASVPFAGDYASYDWYITSNGIIKSTKPYKNRILWKGESPGKVTLGVNVSNSNGTCFGVIESNVSERQVINVTEDVDLNDLINKSENKILRLQNGTYQDNLIIRVKNIIIESNITGGATLDTRGSDYCILIDNTSGVSIKSLNLVDCKSGIIIYNSTDCTVEGNNVSYKNKSGIFLDCSHGNKVIDNIIKPEIGGAGSGIQLNNSKENVIENNDIKTKTYTYIFDIFSNNNKMVNRVSSKVLYLYKESKINCSLDCKKSNRHKLFCEDHQENRNECTICRLCSEIEQKNTMGCIK